MEIKYWKDLGTAVMVYNIERFATEDGRGIRTVVFLKGCGLSCKWCANPESQSRQPQVLVKTNVCVGCGRCMALCPQKAIHYMEGYGYITDQTQCSLCGVCIKGCYVDAREMLGREYTQEELLQEIGRDGQYYRMSGGGVTFSGGEPLLFYPVICSLAEKIRAEGYNTLVETCGHVSRTAVEAVCDSVEFIYYDFKHIDPLRHKELTGSDNYRIRENLEWLCGHFRGHLAVRYPYIPGCNGDGDSVRGFLRYVKELRNIKEIIFLPYHRLGFPKYQGLGRVYEMGDMPSLKKADLFFLKEMAQEYGLNVKIQ